MTAGGRAGGRGWSTDPGRTGGQQVVADDGDDQDGRRGDRDLRDESFTWDWPPVEAPRGSLGLTLDPVGDDVDDPVGALGRAVAEPVVEKSLDVALLGHAERPSVTVVRASASRAARMARWAWWSRDRAVPGGMPRVSAISDGAYPR